MGRSCICCSQCLSWASVASLAIPAAEWILRQQWSTIYGVPGQISAEYGDQQTQSPNRNLCSLEALSEIHNVHEGRNGSLIRADLGIRSSR